jgi:uncharacterized membrane protein YgcG
MRRLFLALLLCLAPLVARADERILDYHADIQVAGDATMTVTETIRVRAEGDAIRRGIYREFPTRYKDRLGNAYVVGFEVLDVERDGRPEPWHGERVANGERIYAGDADILLPPDTYTYTFRYRTNRQLGFFEDHDELYWNVTGNGWQFPIDRASDAVTLPAALPPESLSMSGYTGHFGATGQAYRAEITALGGRIETTRALGAGEGLTLVLTWPKGVVQPPTSLQRLLYTLQDNVGLLLALLALIGSAIYLYRTWRRHGRDPEGGVVFPHYEPPAGYSPASARYVSRMGYDNKTFAAAVINLAVKGYLTISQDGKTYVLRRRNSDQALAAGESALLDKLFSGGNVLELHHRNHTVMRAARKAHEGALRRHYLNTYFRTNTVKLLPSFLGSAAVLVIVLLAGWMVPLAALLFALNVALHALFLYLMKAPSTRGRALLDKLEGFRLYLDVAEKDDLARSAPPKMTPQLFEAYLPFALALGVEQGWAERFAREFILKEPTAHYRPNWYHGDFDGHRIGSFADNVGSSLSSAISSSSSPPGSSSGGGGGSSGGGGGGGGGGGW